MRDCTIFVAKNKALISSAVTPQLICAFVYAYAKSRFSHDATHLVNIHVSYPIHAISRVKCIVIYRKISL